MVVDRTQRTRRIRRQIWVVGGFVIGLLIYVWLLNVSKPGKQVDGCFQGCAMPEGEHGRFLHILSLNILHDYPDYAALPQRLNLIATEIKKLNVDIALLQEVPNSDEYGESAAYLAALTGMNYAYLRANGNRGLIRFEEGVVILSRFPLESAVFTELAPAAGFFFEHRVVLGAMAVTPQGKLDLFVTHLTDGAADINAVQAESLLEFVNEKAEHTAVIAGDFNVNPNTPQIKLLTAQWIDSYQMSHPDEPGWTCCVDNLTTANTASIKERVDYLFVTQTTSHVSIVDVQQVFERPFPTQNGLLWASDHIGLLMTLDIGTQRE